MAKLICGLLVALVAGGIASTAGMAVITFAVGGFVAGLIISSLIGL